ncbi:sensor histidine kinase [Paenibacillus sp. 598K]|nr:sensor histidine kinase [Paenibacillus sp. 598K]
MPPQSSSIKRKLFAIFLSVSIVPICLITYLSYDGYSKLIQRHVTATAANLLDHSMSKTIDALDEMANLTQTLAYQPYSPENLSVIDILRRHRSYTENLNDYSLLQSQRDLKFLFGNILYSYRYANGIYLFTASGNSFYYARSDHGLPPGYDPTGAQWYEQTLQHGSYVSGIEPQPFARSQKRSVLFSRLIVDPDTKQPLGVVAIDCNLGLFDSASSAILPQQSAMFMTSLSGELEYAGVNGGVDKLAPAADYRQRLAGQEQGQFWDEDGQYVTIYKTMPDYPWKLVLRVAMAELGSEYMPTRDALITIAATCVLMFGGISYVLSRRVTRPIVNLSRIMKSSKSTDVVLESKFLKGNDEIAALYYEYHAMMLENKAVIKERYENQIITLDAQMQALEAQINSHFLYNTLETMNSIADMEGVLSITVMTKALGDMFRYSIKTESERVRLRDEIAHVTNYLTIQKIRFGDRLDYRIDIDELLQEESILKLILQPLVENAIVHGLEASEERGLLLVTARMDDRSIAIRIEDNGCGMDEEALGKLRRQLEQLPRFTELGRREMGHIGIANIDARIRLYYGASVTPIGVAIDSQRGQGTTVIVHVPRIHSQA